MTKIHPSAVIDKGAKIDKSVEIGPFCHIGSQVELQKDVKLHAHVVITGNSLIGEGTEIYPFACLGSTPQDLKFQGENTRLIIGKHNRIREYVTMNPGTKGGGEVTKVGDHGLFMAGSHIAHDCVVGDHVILANNATAAGHVHIGDYAILGGLSAIHQFVRIGEYAFVGGMSGLEHDIIPFGMAIGDRARLQGLNIVGLKRANFPRETIHNLRKAYRQLFANEGTLQERIEDVKSQFAGDKNIDRIVAFMEKETGRGLCMPAQQTP